MTRSRWRVLARFCARSTTTNAGFSATLTFPHRRRQGLLTAAPASTEVSFGTAVVGDVSAIAVHAGGAGGLTTLVAVATDLAV